MGCRVFGVKQWDNLGVAAQVLVTIINKFFIVQQIINL